MDIENIKKVVLEGTALYCLQKSEAVYLLLTQESIRELLAARPYPFDPDQRSWRRNR